MTTTSLSDVENKGAARESVLSDGHVPITIQNIRNLVRRIANRFQPEKIVLFGSYAYGKPGRDSDVDLLVVMHTSLSFASATPGDFAGDLTPSVSLRYSCSHAKGTRGAPQVG